MIRLGPAGTAGLGYEEAFKAVSELGLTALEVEFTYGVRMTPGLAKEVGALAKRCGISLSVHGPYYINLASLETAKIAASEKRILDSCHRAHLLGAKYVVFHAGFYQQRDKDDIYHLMAERISGLNRAIRQKGWKVTLAPELTGKPTQFGDLDELTRLKEDTGCHLCIDFAHWKARTQGRLSYADMFSQLKGLKEIHAHFSGIEYTEKGERRHQITPEKELRELLESALGFKGPMTIINESPDPVGDSVNALRILRTLKSS